MFPMLQSGGLILTWGNQVAILTVEHYPLGTVPGAKFQPTRNDVEGGAKQESAYAE